MNEDDLSSDDEPSETFTKDKLETNSNYQLSNLKDEVLYCRFTDVVQILELVFHVKEDFVEG